MKLKAHDGVSGIALLGVEYALDADGFATVPDDLVPVAVANGFDAPVVPDAE